MSRDVNIRWGWKSIGLAKSQKSPGESALPVRRGGTFIGPGAIFDGVLTLCGDFRIDAEFRGELSTDGTIIVGPSGSVVGNIRAREVEVLGAVVGDVSARRQLTLHSSARLHGDIETACLEIAKHAYFCGTTSMTHPLVVQSPDASPEPSISIAETPPAS